MTLVKANINDLRAASASLSSIAGTVESAYDTYTSKARAFNIDSSSLSSVPGYIQDLRDASTFASAKADVIEMVNSSDGKQIPSSGEVSYEISGDEATTLEGVENELGEALANMASEIAVSDYEENDPRVAKFYAYLLTWGSTEQVVSSMYENLGPTGTLALTQSVGNCVGMSSDEDEIRLAQAVLELIRTSLHRASTAWSESDAEQFGEDLVEAARYPDPNSPYALGSRTESLNWLLYNTAAASDAFVWGAAQNMDRLQKQDEANGAVNGWTWMGQPTVFVSTMLNNDTNRGDAAWIQDTPSVVMHALGDHPRIAFEFFNTDYSRITHWGSEYDFAAYDGDLSGVAAALDVASTNSANRSSHPMETASIAAQGLEALISRSNVGPGKHDHNLDISQALENILETYMVSTADSYASSQTSDARPTDDRNGDGRPDLVYTVTSFAGGQVENCPWFDSATLDAALSIIGRDGRATIDLRTAVNDAELNGIPPGTTVADFSTVVSSWARVEGHMANAIGTGGIAKAEDDDKYALTWIEIGDMTVSELSDVAVKFAPGRTKKPLGWGINAFADWIREKAVEKWVSHEENARINYQQAADKAYTDFVIRMLFASDRLGFNGHQSISPTDDADSSDNNKPQDANSGPLGAAGVYDADGNYRLITLEEYNRLSPKEKDQARAALKSFAISADGLGEAGRDLETNFHSGFHIPFKDEKSS